MEECYTGWGRRNSRGASSSGQRDKNETWRGAKEYENANDKVGGKEGEKKKRRKRRKENEKEEEKTKIKSLSITQEDLWALQKVLSSRKGRFSATYKKNTEANTKVCDLIQKTMQALDRLAGVYATFGGTWANVEKRELRG